MALCNLPPCPSAVHKYCIWETGGKRDGGRKLAWACANTGGFCLESRVLILDVALSCAVVLALSDSTIQNQCISLGVQSSIKLFIHLLFHVIYTVSRSTIIFVRFYLYCFFFFPYTLNFLLKSWEATSIARRACRVVKRSPTKATRHSGDIWSSHTLLVWEHIGKNSRFQSREQSSLLRGHRRCTRQHGLIQHSLFPTQTPPQCMKWNKSTSTCKNTLLTSDTDERDGKPQQPVVGKLQIMTHQFLEWTPVP